MTRVCLALLVVFMAQSVAAQTRVAVIVSNFDTDPPATDQAVRSTMAVVDAFYQDQSYHQYLLTSDVYGLYVIPYSANYTANIAAARQAATMAGVDLSAYTKFYYFFPSSAPPCALCFSSLDPPFDGVAHEYGHHILGYSNHEHGVRCDAVSGLCVEEEYGNRLSIMGFGRGHFSAALKSGRGWLPWPIPQITTSGEYVIAPLATPLGDGVKAFRVVGGFKGNKTYVLEYRQPVGFDNVPMPYDPANVYSGVLIYTMSDPGLFGFTTALQQMTPYLAGTLQAPALPIGATFCDKDGHVGITAVSSDASGVRVRVKFGGKCP